MSKLLLIDGSNVAYRWLKNPDVMLHSYAKTVLSLIRSFDCQHALVSFDNKGSSFRKEIYPEYKENRVKDPAKEYFYEILKQVPEHLTAHDISSVALEYVETDDVIAWLCLQLHDKLDEILIISSDKDLYQLLTWDNVKIYSLIKQTWTTKESFISQYDIDPSHWVEAKAIMGDTGDNIKGINLVGEKRSIAYIKQYGPEFEDIEINLPKKKKKLGKIDQNLLAGKEIVMRNRRLVDLLTYADEIIPDEYKDALMFYMQEEGIDV